MRFYLYFILPFFISCHTTHYIYKEVTTITKPSLLLVDTVSTIKLSNSLSWKHYSTLKGKNTNYLLVDKTVRIDKIDLQTGQTQVINLDTAVTNQTEANIESVYAHTADSIFLLQGEQLALINDSGITLWRMPINQIDSTYQTANVDDVPIYYDKNTHHIYVEQYCYSCGLWAQSFFEKWRESSINILTRKETPLIKPFSNLYKQGNYYGFAIQATREHTDSCHIYTFALDPNIYVYNKYTQQTVVFGGRSAYHTERIIPKLNLKDKNNTEVKMQHLTVVASYNKITYDATNKLYFRTFEAQMPLKNADNTYNTFSDKKRYLQIFDKKFNLLQELPLKQGFYCLNIANDKGLLFAKTIKNGKLIYTLKFHEQK